MMHSPNGNCPLCEEPASSVNLENHGEDRVVNCPRCGQFTITDIVLIHLEQTDKYKLSAWTRNKMESGKISPRIDKGNIEAIISSFPDYTVSDKQRLLLKVLAENTSYPGESVSIDYWTMWPLIWASGSKEIKYMTTALVDRGLIELGANSETKYGICKITPKGWDYLDNIKREISESNQAFVAMSFDPSMNNTWIKGIKPAIKAVGYNPYRVDNDTSNLERIDAKIEAEIKRSRFLVADVTGGNQGVYYEAGFAKGLGIDVIWCVREGNEEDMHFDTKQYKHIIWKNPEDLVEKLEVIIIAAFGKNDGTNHSTNYP